VVLQFPKWTDGRAYSQAVLLRARLRFAGEIRATGEVLVDMLPLLRAAASTPCSCAPTRVEAHAERALGFFSGHYQRRAAAAAFARAGAETAAPRDDRAPGI
jgi:uncharacterized protein (DUF934 family)